MSPNYCFGKLHGQNGHYGANVQPIVGVVNKSEIELVKTPQGKTVQENLKKQEHVIHINAKVVYLILLKNIKNDK